MQKKGEGIVFHDEDFDYLPEEFQFLFFQFFKAYSRDRTKPDFSAIPDQTDIGEANRLLKLVLKAYWQKMEDRAVGEKVNYAKKKESNKERQARYREKQKKVTPNDVSNVSNASETLVTSANVTPNTNTDTNSRGVSVSEFESGSVFGSESEFESVVVVDANDNNNIPTEKEISDYVAKNNISIDPRYFYSYYTQKNWRKDGRMIDWRETAKGWARRQIAPPRKENANKKVRDLSDREL